MKHIIDNGVNNLVKIGDGFNHEKLSIVINGNGNKVIIKDTNQCNHGNLTILINSDNSELYIGENCYIDAGGLICVCGNAAFKRCENASMRIGNNVSIGGVQMISYNSNAHISVGDDCMMAWGIMIYNTDAHPIYDLNSRQIINKVDKITIGDKCWIGADVKILKNVVLPNETIVGFGSIVSKSFSESNTAIAGNPAKIVKKGVYWEQYDEDYIDNKKS